MRLLFFLCFEDRLDVGFLLDCEFRTLFDGRVVEAPAVNDFLQVFQIGGFEFVFGVAFLAVFVVFVVGVVSFFLVVLVVFFEKRFDEFFPHVRDFGAFEFDFALFGQGFEFGLFHFF